jgi:hypothetical protein
MTRQRVADRLEPKERAAGRTNYGSIAGIGIAARAVRTRTRNYPHAGLLYRRKTEVRLFEMLDHKKLSDELARPEHHFVWIEPAIPRERVRLIVERARLVYRLNQQSAVPYGFAYHTSTFDERGGLRLGPNEIGLTCSTIVVAILESERIRLLDPTTWPPPDTTDKEARRAFLAELTKSDPEHAERLKADIEAPRISPEEVVAAAGIHPDLGTFENLQDGAAVVRDQLTTT